MRNYTPINKDSAEIQRMYIECNNKQIDQEINQRKTK